MNVPMTRLVKNPRLSLTTIGVLICKATSMALAIAASEVFSHHDLERRHLVHRGEEVHPDEVLRTGHAPSPVR